MPVAEDQWAVVKTEPLPKQQASADPWAVVKTEPAQSAAVAPVAAPKIESKPAESKLPTLESKRGLAGKAWDWARNLPTGIGGAKGTFGQVFDDAGESISSGWAHTQSDTETSYLPHVVNLLDTLEKKVGTPERTPAQKLRGLGNDDPLRFAINAYRSADPKQIDQIKDRTWSIRNALIGTGAAGREVADGLATPENTALIFALGETELPRAVHMLTSMGFAGEQAYDAVRLLREGAAAYQKGDAITAMKDFTAGPADALFAFLTGVHAVHEAGPAIDDTLNRVVTLDTEGMEAARPPQEGWRIFGSHPDTGLPVLGNPDQIKSAWNPNASSRALEGWKVYQAVQAGRAARPEKKQEEAAGRAERTETAKNLTEKRDDLHARRVEAQAQPTEGPTRQVDSQIENGHISYRGQVWGEDHSFGVSSNGDGNAVYRKTPRGTEWLDQEGNFVEEPTSLYFNSDPEAVDTVARLSSLTATADTLAEQTDSTGEQKKEASELADIRRSLVNGEIDAKEAQKRAGIAEKVNVPDEFLAARDGRLNGPFHESNADAFFNDLRQQAEAAGMDGAEVEKLLDEAPALAREQTENNLHHVYRPGDYLVSKRGVMWTLDSKGLLHPDDGGSPVPLMKKGQYSNQSMQLAASGRVGYGTKTREQRRLDRVRDRDVAKALQDQQETVRREMLLAKQQEGLETAPEALPREDEAAKQERRARLLSRPPRAPESAVSQIVREVFRARPGVTDVLQSIADKKGVSVEEVMRQQLASDPERANTIEAKIARLEAGDEISDQFRKDRPWKVEEQNGKLFIRSGQATPLPLDRLNPSERVKQIVARGEIKSVAPEFEGWDATRAAFESAHVIHQQKLTEEVRERATGNVKDPEPRTPKQAGRQAQAATRRANAAEAVATKALIDSLSPTTTDVDKAVADVEKAQREVKTAEEGYAQQVTAQGKTITEEPFPQRADISIGLKGKTGVIVQNNREIPFHYELVPLPSIQTSHEWQGKLLVPNPDYPDSLQPRTISQSESEQNALRAEVGQYDFRQYADRTINGAMGPAIIDPGGRGVGGNTRLAIMKRHLQNLDSISDPDQKDAALAGFRSAMRETAQEVGIRRYPDDTENYAVVRVLDKPISNIRDAADLGRLFNKSVSVQITKSAKGISYSKSFDNPLLGDIGRRVEAYDGIVPAMQADPDFFRDIVVNRFGIVPEEEADWFEEKPGRGKVLTEPGRDQFTKALLGTVVDNPSILNRIEGKTPYRALERALGYVVKMKALPDLDITSKINEALAASAETATTDPQLHSSKDPWKATYQPQQAELSGMETDIPPEPDRMTEALWRALHSSDAAVPRVFNDRLKAYLGEETSKGGWMFGEHTETPVDSFNRAFSRQLREVAESRGDKKDELTQEEFDAALRNREFSDQEREEAEDRQSGHTKGGRGESSERRRPETQRLRKRIDQMTADEMREALLTSRKTGLPNRTDFEERNDPAFGGTPAPIVGMSDVDGLKAFNDTYGYAAGDKLLKAKADALREVGIEAYHDKGDEFLYRAETSASLTDQLEKARKILRETPIEVTKDGKTEIFKGVDFSFGVGRDLADAEGNQKTAKAERTAKGERERGKFGNIKISPPPKPPSPADMLRVEKDIKGYVTPAELKTFLSDNPATKDHAPELMRTAQIMAEYVYDADPPVGVDRKEALAWIMKERLAGIEAGELKSKRGEYSDPNIEVGTGILKLHKAADPTTFIHEFAHVIFPMLSDDDMRAIATIEKAGDAQWDGTRKGMTPEVYTSMTEKLANGLEKFLRDQNPKDFNAEVKAVLAKVKEIFRKIYLAFKGDPLAPYTLSSDAVEMFDKMFHVTGSDVPDEWRAEVKKARAEEKKIGKPEEAPHPLQKIARDMGGIGLKETIEGRVVDSIGDRVDPKKPTAVVIFKSEESAASAYTGIINGDSKIEHAELLETPDGKFGIKFNTATKMPKSILFQDLPEKEKTESPEFKRWFADSKVVDEKGKPLRVFHGTTGDFDVFDANRLGSSTSHPTSGLGFFFSSDPAVASLFAGKVDDTQWPPKWKQNIGAQTVPVYLKIDKPFELSADQWRRIVTNGGADGEPQFKTNARKYIENQRALLEKQGYDGVHVKGDPKYRDSMTEEYGADNWVTFRPEQIKSSIGNRGTFDPTNPSILYQNVPERHPGLQFEDLQKRLAGTPTYKLMERKLLQLQIENLKRDIREQHGLKEPAIEAAPEIPKQALQEAKSGKSADRVREVAHGVSGAKKPQGIGRIPQPPKPNGPRDAATGGQRGGAGRSTLAREPASLENVKPVSVLPLKTERGAPVGTIKGEKFDSKIWTEGLKRAGLPENALPPTVGLSRAVADKLKFPGQKQSVQIALSALEQGDGVVLANSTGSGKTFLATGLIKEFQEAHPNSRILYVTKNRTLKEKTKGVAANTFGFEIDTDTPKDIAQTGAWAVSYVGMMNDAIYKQMDWDLVIADESGEARNWFKEENQQGKMLKQVIDGSKKAVYLSATPFHSPSEYGYLDKLNLWPKGGFDRWIQENFAHEKIGDKIVARLDPSKQAKLRQQLIDRGQMVSQAISYDGYTAHFGVVPVTDQMKRGLDRIREGFARAQSQLLRMGKKGAAQKAAAFEATYTKAFLERERLPQAIQLAKKAMDQGWQVIVFSEHSAEDLFRRPRSSNIEPSTYQELDDEMGGELSKIIPAFPDAYDELRSVFGSKIGDYSGRGNTMAERKKALLDFQKGDTPMLYTTYAAGGIGVDMHDADFPDLGIKGGDKPRLSIYLGPPYSGVLLEQAMGRTWRFGVKSDTHSVFLASDSEPDIRLMTTKVGPRMRALRAAVLGERDSLAQVMATYTDDEKVRQRQDMLAYSEGDEEKVSAARFQVRSKSRQVGINDWSAIIFPSAETAKNKGMKYGEEIPGGDWSTLFQAKFGMRIPDGPEDANAKDTIDGIANGLANGKTDETPLQNLDPSDRDVVIGAMSATASNEVEIPVDRDKEAAAKQGIQAQLKMPGNRDQWVLTWPQGAKVGVWKYLGNPDDLKPVEGDLAPPPPHNVRTWYIGNMFSQEIGVRNIARQAGVPEVGRDIVRMNRSWQADKDLNFSQFSLRAADIMRENKLDPHDRKVMGEIWDTVKGKWSSGDPAINKAAGEMSSLMEMINDELAAGGVKIKTPTGDYVAFSKSTRDPHYMPQRIDWDAKVEDPLTGEVNTLRELMGGTIPEQKRARIIQMLGQSSGMTPNQVVDYLNNFKPGTPVLGHVQRTRTMDFPIYRKDWETLLSYFDQAAEGIATEKNFGTDRGKLNKEIDKIPSLNGRSTIRSMFNGLLEPQDWRNTSARFYNAMIGFEALSKMTLSVVKVPFHLVHVPMAMKGKTVPFVKALLHTVTNPRGVMENATYVGTIARQLNVGDLIGEGANKGLAHAVFQKYLFNAAYRWGRAIAGESARVWMEQYALHELKKGGTSAEHTRRLLKETMLIPDKAVDDALQVGRWSPEDLAKSQTAFTNMTLFSDNPLQMPAWARLEVTTNTPGHHVSLHRALRLTYALQSFSVKTTSLLREHLWDEVMVHHNYKPLAYFLAIYPIAGEVLRASSAGVKGTIQLGLSGAHLKATGQGQKKEDAWDKYFESLKDDTTHGVVGLLKRYIDNLTFGIAFDRTRRFADPLLNLAEGKRGKQLGPGMQYLLEDEAEQDIGAAWSSLVIQPLKLTAEEYREMGSKASGTAKETQKEVKTLFKYIAQEFPIANEIPELQDYLKKKAVNNTPRYF